MGDSARVRGSGSVISAHEGPSEGVLSHLEQRGEEESDTMARSFDPQSSLLRIDEAPTEDILKLIPVCDCDACHINSQDQ